MKRKLFLAFVCLFIFTIIYFIVFYFIMPFEIPNNVNEIRILDCRTNEEITVKDNKKIGNLANKINETKKAKSTLKEMPNGATYKLTFIDEKNKELCVISIFDMNKYYLLTFKSSFKNYRCSMINDNRAILNIIDELYNSTIE